MSGKGRPETFAECLRFVVAFLDLGDQMATILAAAQGKEGWTTGRAVQEDLLKLAITLDDADDLDSQIMDAMTRGVVR